MRRALPHLLALVLGIGAATLAACADGSERGVPADAAADLKSELEDVRQRVDDARCRALVGQLRQVDTRVDRLPSSVDAQLRRRLSDGAENLAGVAERECDENRDAKKAETTTTETTTSPEPTESQPPTTTAEPPATATTPPPTMTTPPPAPAPQPAPAPAPNPGGGTPPQDVP